MINSERLTLNRKYQAKLSYHRSKTVDLREQIAEFFETNFDIVWPKQKYILNNLINSGNETFNTIVEMFPNLCRTYYTLGNFGESFASLFTNEKGQFETYTNAHVFSKHRLDPVWNYRKSNLIRNIYRNYLKSTRLFETYKPVHITLTVPHEGGKWNGKRFYVNELITAFHEIRRSKKWKTFVYAGEYGIEVKASPNKANGLHIHLHSLAFLQDGIKTKDFQKWLLQEWEKATGANQIWVESIYFHQKGENGRYLTEIKANTNDLTTIEQPDGTYSSESSFIEVRKKIYVDEYAKELKNSNLPEDEKDEKIINAYLFGILETIKYHFKADSLTLDGNNFDLTLIEEVLENTSGKRLYSRYGAFYKVPELSFNNLQNTNDDDIQAESTEEVINPFTGETVEAKDTMIVMFYPERQRRTGKDHIEPYKLLNYKQDIYIEVSRGKPIKQVLSEHLRNKFPKRQKVITT